MISIRSTLIYKCFLCFYSVFQFIVQNLTLLFSCFFLLFRGCLHLKHFLRDLRYSSLSVGQERPMINLQLLLPSLLPLEIQRVSIKKTSLVQLNLLKQLVRKHCCQNNALQRQSLGFRLTCLLLQKLFLGKYLTYLERKIMSHGKLGFCYIKQNFVLKYRSIFLYPKPLWQIYLGIFF